MDRFIFLEHTGAPDDPPGRHFDLLLEAGDSCRTWRLAVLPEVGGVPVSAVELPPHRLAWLDHEAGEVSGGRGFARRIDAGVFELASPEAGGWPPGELVLRLAGKHVSGTLRLERRADGWFAMLSGA